MNKKAPIAALLCFFALVLFGLCFAEKNGDVYFSTSPIEQSEVLPSDAVLVQKVNDDYYLFLPGFFDLDSLYAACVGSETVSVGGRDYMPGEAISGIAPGEKIKISVGGRSRAVSVFQGSNIHAVFLNTVSGSFDFVNRKKGNEEAGSAAVFSQVGEKEYDGGVDTIKLRGNSTLDFAKKNYNIKLSKKADLGGMGKSKKWVLVSGVKDHSLIRNQICMDMARFVGLPSTLDLVPCDLWLNHEYNGEYLLTEKIEIANYRVEINDLKDATEAVNDKELDEYPQAGSEKVKPGQSKYFDIPNDPEDISGGYIIEYENYQARYSGDPSAYTTLRGKVIVVKDPKEISKAQADYIASFIQGYENALFDKDGTDPGTGKKYYEFVDFESLVLKYMLEEISKNEDSNASSQYYYKPSDSESAVAFAGPAWDYDVTFGGYAPTDKTTLLNPKGLYASRSNDYQYWWPRLYAREEFLKAVKGMWEERYSPAIRVLLGEAKDESGMLKSIDEYAERIKDSAEMNFVRWPIHYLSSNAARTGRTFGANIEYLKDFITQRREFLDETWR